MPVYMDIHKIPGGITPEEVAKAHDQDVAVQSKYGVSYHKYWVNEKEGKIFCLCHAPNEEAAIRVHQEAHGHVAEKIIQVEPEMANLFLGGSEVSPNGAVMFASGQKAGPDPAIRTIFFTDIVDSTALTQSIGDEQAMEILHVHDRIVREALQAFGGREVKHTGDGIMASFVSAAGAVKCASRVQRDLSKHAQDCSHDCAIKVRIGLAAGEPVEHHDDLFGSTVQLAARLCAHAQPEQIVVSNVVAELCVGKTLPFQDLGKVTLKGFERPQRVHAVAWPEESTRA